MIIRHLGTESDGARSVEIRSDEISYRALLRNIHSIPGAIVTKSAHDLMNDNTNITIRYNDVILTIETPFSDYIINCSSPCGAFDEFVSKLSSYKVKWWERFI
jgi:hypothetical protein